MSDILVHGFGGRLGSLICRVAADCGLRVVGGVRATKNSENVDFPVFYDIWDCDIFADVIIDSSIAAATPNVLDFALVKKKPLVVCTTGLPDACVEQIRAASEHLPILYSANMSLGVTLVYNLVRQAAAALFDKDFDIEIVEAHHNRKNDAPSGTALVLADVINSTIGGNHSYNMGRAGTGRRKPDEIGIHAIRGGTLAGSHKVIFAGHDEMIEISHSAMSGEVFARGACAAAKFLINKPPGLYDIADLFTNFAK
ncbi:MAG: 4-hydroxy-tetrahydrodipicolinate reductase [Defluviitaleaceae bacterium]|nr:4-hydroxy-tetrahydrodipicolinate reductase [Defluviitaleaceae bacterium]